MVTFIQRLRNDERVRNKPSIRQSIGLLQLLNARGLRSSKLAIHDLIRTAVATTYYEDQPTAREIAMELVQSEINAKIVEEKGLLSVSTLRKVLEVNNVMKDYLKDDQILQQMLKLDVDKMDDLRNLSDLVFNTKKGDLKPNDLKLFDAFGRLESYLPQIKNPETKILAENLLGKPSWKDDLKEYLAKNPHRIGDLFGALAKQDMNHPELSKLLRESLQNSTRFEDYARAIQKSGLQADPPQSIFSQVTQESISSALKSTKAIDAAQKSQISSQVIEAANEKKIEIPIEDLLDNFQPGTAWSQAFQQQVQQALKSPESSARSDLLEELVKHKDQYGHQQYRGEMADAIKSLADQMIDEAPDLETLEERLGYFGQNDISFDKSKGEAKGQQLGLSPQQMDNLVKRDMQALNNNIARGNDNFQQYSALLHDIPLDGATMGGLVRQGLKMKLPMLVGAIAHIDPEAVVNFLAADGTEEEMEQLIEGMAAGPGMNILTTWFDKKDRLAARMLPSLKNLTKSALIDTAIQFAKQHFGFIKRGAVLESGALRPYREGDDIEQVVIDDTVHNLIDQGKSLDHLTSGDIICQKEKGTTIKVLLIIDCSGSMSGQKYLSAALASTMLLYVLRPEDFSVICFESNTHILKSFEDRFDMDHVAEDLLSIQVGGGTQIEAAMQYLRDTLEKMEPNTLLMSFIFSDFEFYETERELHPVLERIRRYSPRLVLFSTEGANLQNIAMVRGYVPLQHVPIPSVKQLPEVIARILRQIQ